MIAVVNGYPCNSSCDVAVARRNVDPRNPHNDPAKAEQLAEADALKGKTPPRRAERPNAGQRSRVRSSAAAQPASTGGFLRLISRHWRH
jgi:hypothetical protein